MVYSRATTSVRAERVLRSVFFCPRAIVEAVRACVRGWMGGQGRRQGSVSRKNEGCTQQRVVRGPSSARPAPTRPSRPVPPVAQAHLAPLCCGTVTASRQPRRRAWPGGTRRGGAIFATPATRARAGGAGRDKGEDGAGEALHEPECGTEAHVGVLSEEREGPEEKPREARRGEGGHRMARSRSPLTVSKRPLVSLPLFRTRSRVTRRASCTERAGERVRRAH